MIDFTTARLNMVESQLRTNRVTNQALLEAFETLPREAFVPEAQRGFAYVDEDIEITPGRHMMEPMVLARLLQAARPGPGDVALDIGCGTGFATAVLARIVATVVAVESKPELVDAAGAALAAIGLDNTVVMRGEITEGHPGQAPYDIILINGAVAEVPAQICKQLAEGGRLVTVVRGPRGVHGGVGRATLTESRGGVISSRVLFDAAVPMLPEFQAAPRFVF